MWINTVKHTFFREKYVSRKLSTYPHYNRYSSFSFFEKFKIKNNDLL